MLLLMLAAGCGFNAVGRWEILAITIGEASVGDAGFLDLAGLEANRVYAPNAALLRHTYDAAGATFDPDPTPEVFAVSTEAEALLDGEQTLNLDYPLSSGEAAAAVMSLLAESGGQMVLEDPDFLGGAGMSWLLSRSDALEEDPTVPGDL